MTALVIDHWRKRYRLRRGERDLLPAIDRTLQEVLDEHLPAALAALGIGNDEALCIRRIQVPLRYRCGNTATENGMEWARLIAAAIRAELASGTILRFASVRAGLLDFAAAVARGELTRTWGWNQLGLATLPPSPSPAQARQQLLAALVRQPENILPVLWQLVHRRLLLSLVLGLRAADIDTLWLIWMDHAGIDRRLLWPAPVAAADAGGDEACGRAAARDAIAALSRSPLFCQLQQRRELLAHAPVTVRQWALLLAMEVQPSLFLTSPRTIVTVLQAIERQPPVMIAAGGAVAAGGAGNRFTGEAVQGADDALGSTAIRGEVEQTGADTADTWPDPPFAGDADPIGTEEAADVESTAVESTPGQITAPDAGADSGNNDQPVVSANATENTFVDTDPQRHATESVPAVISSDLAGVFFLIPLLKQSDLIRRLRTESAVVERPMPWLLRQLVDQLLAIPADDPALKLFCGIAADADWPFAAAEWPAGDSEAAVMQRYADELVQALVDSIDWGIPATGIMQRLCRRRAQLLDDGGWLELRFSLRDVDTDIRRAALDLDPDFVPWLGKVVKYRYG